MNVFLGKLKDKVFGGKKPTSSAVIKQHIKARPDRKPESSAYSRRTTKGAFGGRGRGRGLKGRPGIKLLRKTVEAGWKARIRVQFSQSAATK